MSNYCRNARAWLQACNLKLEQLRTGTFDREVTLRGDLWKIFDEGIIDPEGNKQSIIEFCFQAFSDEIVSAYGELAPPMYFTRQQFLEIKEGFTKCYAEYCRWKTAKIGLVDQS
jgi:hypothetical protein